jgi:hypothetical protein
MRREGSLEVSSSAIITAAVILGGCVATSGTLLFIGLLRNARAQDAMAAALVKRNSIEAQKTGEGFEAYRRGILQEADELAAARDREVVEEIRIAGSGFWRDEGGVQGRVPSDATVVVGPDWQNVRTSDRQGQPERGTRYTDVSDTTVTNIRDMQTVGFEVRVAGVEYRDLPFDMEGATHPSQLAQSRHLLDRLWYHGQNWMLGAQPAAHPDERLYYPHPTFTGSTWYDAYRAMFARTYGFGLYANIEDQFPELSQSPNYQRYQNSQSGGHAGQ